MILSLVFVILNRDINTLKLVVIVKITYYIVIVTVNEIITLLKYILYRDLDLIIINSSGNPGYSLSRVFACRSKTLFLMFRFSKSKAVSL